MNRLEKHIHISLVGGQPAPVYHGVMAADPDRVIFVHSAQTKSDAERISNELDIQTELLELNPVDLEDINFKVDEIKKNLDEGCLVSVNLSGGTKAWSIVFYEKFRSCKDVILFYIDQNNNLWDFLKMSSSELSFDMEMQFKLYGNIPTKYHLFSDYTDDDDVQVAKIQNLRRHNYSSFNDLSSNFINRQKSNAYVLRDGSFFEWDRNDLLFNVSIANRNGVFRTEVLDSPNSKHLLLNNGWFEYVVAKILNGWIRTKAIRLNCVFPTKDDSPKNEIDIIVNAGTKLLFVECKTQIHNETDIDKFASAVRVYGGIGSKALFVTDARMNEKAKEKCRDNGVILFSIEEFGGIMFAEKSLYDMLDKELFNINK